MENSSDLSSGRCPMSKSAEFFLCRLYRSMCQDMHTYGHGHFLLFSNTGVMFWGISPPTRLRVLLKPPTAHLVNGQWRAFGYREWGGV